MYYPKTVQFRGVKLYSFAMRDCTVSHSETYKFFMVKLYSFAMRDCTVSHSETYKEIHELSASP